MASKIVLQMSKRFAKRCFSSSPAAVPLSEAIPDLSVSSSLTELQPQPVQVSKLANGITVASRQNHTPYCNISVYVKCGSRVESYEQRGITHLIKDSALLSTKDKSSFLLFRELDYIGSNISAMNTREHVIYTGNCMTGNQETVINALQSVICSPALYDWEIKDIYDNISYDIQAQLSQPRMVVMEELHKYSFRSGLNNSVLCPQYNTNKFTSDHLKDFISDWYTGHNISVVGAGVNHQELVDVVNKRFCSIPEGLTSTVKKAEYVGGCEIRLDADTNLTHAAIVCKGTSLTVNPKDIITGGVLQMVLGDGQYLKWGSGSVSSRLNKVVASTIDTSFSVNAMNLSYSDNGLFGIYAVSDSSTIGKVLKRAMNEFSEIGKGNISSTDLSRAKNQLKTKYLMNSESVLCDIQQIAQQVSLKGSYTPVNEVMSIIDSVSEQDIVQFAKMIFATRPTLVAYGNLSDTPRLDELVTGISVKQ